MTEVLVVGGAGYIGSHAVQMLLESGYDVLVLDDLSTGFREAVGEAELIEGDLGDAALLDEVFGSRDIDAVMHFAARIAVGESVQQPLTYYDNNVCKTLALLDAMKRHRVPRFIFSSSAAVFGEPEYVPIDEQHPTRPVNPYGRTKLMVEWMLQDLEHAYGLRSISLRYFNAAGADPQTRLGCRNRQVTNLIPVVLQVASGARDEVTVFGQDYDTEDGTGVRDYIHVTDLCDAHLKALRHLERGASGGAFNLGNGSGYSVQQVIDAARRVTGRPIEAALGARRPGDPASLVADASLAQQTLGWQPRYPELDTIIEHAWRWERRLFGA